jgi:DNA-binding IclR family transcriptional regulator
LSELSRALHINKVTALRLLVTFQSFSFVEKDPKQKSYRIGRAAFYVGSGFIAAGRQKKALHIMSRLAAELSHTITLSVLDGAAALFIERVDGNGRVKVTVDIGSRTPAYSSAAGKALLAGLSDFEIRERLKGIKLERAVARPRLTVNEVVENVRAVRKCGYAINNEDSTRGLLAIAVPVRSRSGEPIAALGAAIPAGVLRSRDEQKAVAARLTKAAQEIENLDLIGASQLVSGTATNTLGEV